MTTSEESQEAQGPTGDRGKPDGASERGYQPEAGGTVEPGQVKPPRGDTAIVPPQKPAPKQ